MTLDRLVFAAFLKREIDKPVFIIGVARSATTYLLNILARDEKNFTCFKFWEILFAPSIIQKYFFVFIIKVDRRIGKPLYKVSVLLDKLFLRQIALLHETSLSKPEEDEMLLLYAFSTMYLAFFFPGVPALDPYVFFDEELPFQKREKIMQFYKRCVQRHIFVFDRNKDKKFLSKNPGFISKTITIAHTFPDARILYMLRSPFQTIPSTISLNLNVYSIFSGRKTENPLALKTTEAIIRWYRMADNSLTDHWSGRSMVVPFKKITRTPENIVKNIYAFLDIVPSDATLIELAHEQEVSSRYKSVHRYDSKLVSGEKKIREELDFIIEGIYKDDI